MADDITRAMDSVRNAFLEAERNGASAKELEKMQEQYKDAINAHLNDRADQIALVKVDQFWERSSSQHEPTMKDFETFRDTMPQELSERVSVRDWLHKKEVFLETGIELHTKPYERSAGLSTELPRDVIDTIWSAGTMDELQSIGSNLSSAVDQTAEIEIRSVKEFEALKEVAREWSREEHQESLDDLRDFRNGLDPEVLQYESVQQYLNDQYDFIYYQPEHVVQTVIQIDNQQEMDSFKDRMKAYEMEHAGLVHI